MQLNDKPPTHTATDHALFNATNANNTATNNTTLSNVNPTSTSKQQNTANKNGTSHSQQVPTSRGDTKSIFMRTAEFLVKYNAFNVCIIAFCHIC
jgi:hypothetical protein